MGGKGSTFFSEPVAAQLAVNGQLLSHERRQALKAKLKAGELEELLFDAVVYRNAPNANHVRFKAGDLPAFAQSFAGAPFLRNHDVQDVGARDGMVVESRLVGDEFHQRIRLSTERGMKDFLEGIIDRFSIGWYFDAVECSVCQQDWMECAHWPGQKVEGLVCELVFVSPRGKETSAVNAPAVQGTRLLEQLCELKSAAMAGSAGYTDRANKERAMAEETMMAVSSPGVDGQVVTPQDSTQPAGDVDLAAEVRALRAQIDAEQVERMIAESRLSEEGQEVVRLAVKGMAMRSAPGAPIAMGEVAQLVEAQRKAEGARVDSQIVRGIRPIVSEGMMLTPLDRLQSAWNWIFGVRGEQTPPPSLRSIRDLYLSITGDFDWYGRFNPEWSQLAAATTTTLAGMTVNALNKVVKMHYENMATYRWYERIVDVAPHDGTTHNVQLITVDGIGSLPVVQEGATYTEAGVGDAKESMAFVKRGHYVGITLESIRRSDIQRIQAIPRLLVQGAIRTRSAAIAGIFTQASGTGPTLADDATVLFHSNHGNVATGAFGSAEWEAARTRIWEQTVPGTGKPLGLWPTFVLVPIELYDDALTEFGYGNGDVGKPNAAGTAQVVNPYGESRLGDPRPVPVPVPDWTDANDWAYIVDPRLHPVIHMAYANAPQGGEHAMPEIFEVTSETSGLMFSNDTMPVKIRDWWSYGVSTYVGIGKNNVT